MEHPDAASIIAEACLCFRARRTSRALTRLYDEALRPLGVQATQLTVLSAIANMERSGGASMRRVAEVLAMDLTTLSRNLRPLRRDGLVLLERAPHDRRVRLTRLTPEGRELLERALPAWRAAQDRVVVALGTELAADLKRALDAGATAGLAALGATAAGPAAVPAPHREAPGERSEPA